MKTSAALCGVAAIALLSALGTPAVQAQTCDDSIRAQFAADVANNVSESVLETRYGHCRGIATADSCLDKPVTLNLDDDGYGSISEAVKSVVNYNVSYEQMNGCGYHPQAELVACDVEIKRTTGYGAFPTGTFEHVLFCFDCDQNGTWEFSTRGFVHVTNNIAAAPTPSWYHLAYSSTFHAPTTCTTNNGGQSNVRAILSWALAPATCTSVPFWGNIINYTARRDP
jgi:hypothetical protein